MYIETVNDWYQYQTTMKKTVLNGKYKKQIKIPCLDAVLVKRDLVQANTYNPNSMPDQKRDDLIESILLAGVAYGISTWWDNDLEKFVVIDGFHRMLVLGYDHLGLEYIPIVPLELTETERMMATWLFNKARGFHQVDLDAELIRSLIEGGMEENEIADTLGIELETVHRYKQVTGIVELFKNVQYSMSWQMKEVENEI